MKYKQILKLFILPNYNKLNPIIKSNIRNLSFKNNTRNTYRLIGYLPKSTSLKVKITYDK